MEQSNTEILQGLRYITRLQERVRREIALRYGLTQLELDVAAFLINNPERDTASDVVELRMLPKGNVSQAVESLMQKGWLLRRQDMEDRRRIHLVLSSAAEALRPELLAEREFLEETLFDGFTVEERGRYAEMNRRISQNAKTALKRERISD